MFVTWTQLHLPVKQVENRIYTRLIAKSTTPKLSDMTFFAHCHSEKLTNLWIRWASYFWHWATSPRQTDWFSACIQWYTISTHWCHSVDIRKGGDSTRLWCCHWWWQNTESVWFPWLRQTQGWVMKCWGWINKKFKTCISCLVVRMLRKFCNQIH